MNHALAKTALIASLIAAAAGAHAGNAGADQRMSNDNAMQGRAVALAETRHARVINLDTQKSANVDCGETVVFLKGGQRFAWKFDTPTHAAVDLRTIAPAGFTDSKTMVYVSRSDAEGS